jgi:hypothetical protein
VRALHLQTIADGAIDTRTFLKDLCRGPTAARGILIRRQGFLGLSRSVQGIRHCVILRFKVCFALPMPSATPVQKEARYQGCGAASYRSEHYGKERAGRGCNSRGSQASDNGRSQDQEHRGCSVRDLCVPATNSATVSMIL